MKADRAIDSLYFGKDDAESDFAAGGLLQQGFLQTLAYEEAKKGRKGLFVGRKGSGKSAICLTLKSSLESQNRVALVTPDEISAEEIRRFSLAGITPESSKELIWRYVFAVQISKYMLKLATNQATKDAGVQKHSVCIKRFLTDNGEIEELSSTSRFWRIVERLKGELSFEAFSVKVKVAGEVKAPSSGAAATDQLDRLEAHLVEIAKQLKLSSNSDKFYILVDQIEKVWSNEPESNSMVIGLLHASKRVAIAFDFVRCAVFLRTDIYEKVRFQEGDKFRGDEFRIAWDEKKLLDLALVRAKASSSVTITAKDLWNHIFPSSIDGEKTPDFLVNLTLMRPRDIIQICNCSRDTAQQNGSSSITIEDINRAARVYSTWKLTDIQNEWSVNYPFLPDICLLLSNKSYVFTKASFERTLKLISADLVQRYPSFRYNLSSSESILQVLYSIGLIGAVRHGKTIYNYHVSQDESLLPGDAEFVVHPGFRSALQTTNAFGEAPVEVDPEIVQGRFRRGSRPGQGIEDSPYEERALSSALRLLDQVNIELEGGVIADDLRRELRRNVKTIQNQLTQAANSFDPTVIRVTIVRASRFLDLVATKLRDNAYDVDKEFVSRLQQVIRTLRQIEYGGGNPNVA
jgi:hypothetical protein